MEYNDANNSATEMWEWQEEEYCLERNCGIDTSHCLWDEVNQSLLYMPEEQTPVKDCVDFSYIFSDVGGNTDKGFEESKESSQSKRRRVLQFTSDSNDTGIASEQNSSAYLKPKMAEDTMMGDGVHGNVQWDSQWNSGLLDDRRVLASESVEQSSEGWLTDCFTENEMQCSQEEMNDFICANEQIDISEFYNIPPEMETDVVQETPPPAPRRIFKGKKSFIKTPMKLTTSVAYPFALIKPCGVQGDITLKDINQRIHAPPPTRSQNNKDEDPSTSYPTSALTGKPVVVKTKIRTEGGKGSITIMRTKG